MLVYGDHSFEAGLQTLQARLYALADRALVEQDNLDLLRTLLILCGQVEQGIHDTLERTLAPCEADPITGQFHLATAQAAEAFYSVAWQQPAVLPPPVVATGTALQNLRRTLARVDDALDVALTVKVPEGFSIYAIYPEQYIVAAAQWLAEHGHQRANGAVVVGIRSIGTALAAVVRTVLAAGGWQVQSFTVRPAGHPYHRQVEISGVQVDPTAFGLIVDEGPGISGSSMAATASALVWAGLDRRNIAFFPGHPNDPGGAGSEAVQAWWQTTPRYVAESKDLTFNGLPLQDALASILPEPVIQVEDFSGGLWRQYVYPDSSAWPALCTAFERIKYRYTLQSGKRVIFKFLGLASRSPDLVSTAESAAALLRKRAAEGLAPPLLGVAYGFIATEWVEGAPADLSVCTPALLDDIGRYIARTAGSAMQKGEARMAIERLAEMLYINTRESLGEQAANLTRRYPVSAMPPQPAYGDGHMQPHEWIRGSDNQLFKVDSVGHDCDHTLIGSQSIAWDVVGAIVEWQLEGEAVVRLLKAFSTASGIHLDGDVLDFYRAAYLAFRLGQGSLAAQVHDPDERKRILVANAVHQRQLAVLLGVALPAQTG